jgi:outer membrane protein, adhesin transport system
VRADRGRASELVQARKSLQQAELAQAQAQSQARAGRSAPAPPGGRRPAAHAGPGRAAARGGRVHQLVADVERSADVAALTAQVDAAGRYADAVAAGGKPQVSWNASAAATGARGGSIGETKPWHLVGGRHRQRAAVEPGAAAGHQRRPQACARRRAAAGRGAGPAPLPRAEVHEQTTASFDRLRRLGAVLRDSEQVRNFTQQQWQQLGRRSLFDVIGAEAEHYNLRISYVNALTTASSSTPACCRWAAA